MAAVSLSPVPISLAAMSSRRAPLTANPNAANSPARASAALTAALKKNRSYASIQREDAYGQQPPAKKQALEHGARASQRSPSKVPRRVQARAAAAERTTPASVSYTPTQKEIDEVRRWQQQQRSRFPKFVFYFESVPDDQRGKLARQVAHLGAVCACRPSTI